MARAPLLAALLVITGVGAGASGASAPMMAHIPGGTFMMGYSKTPIPASLGRPEFPNGDKDESPAHKVAVSSFFMATTGEARAAQLARARTQAASTCVFNGGRRSRRSSCA